MATGFVNRVIFNASSTGTGSFVVASAVTGYLTPAQASATDQKSYRYAAQIVDGSGNITDWEIGTGTYTVSSVTSYPHGSQVIKQRQCCCVFLSSTSHVDCICRRSDAALQHGAG